MLMLVHFWWWEFGLFKVESWTFGVYLFIISYAIALFLLCALLFPDSMWDYRSYEEFSLSAGPSSSACWRRPICSTWSTRC